MTEAKTELNDREYERLKALVESGKKYHYRNFVFASLVVVLLLKDENEILKLILEVELPVRILMVVLFFITVLYTVITMDIFLSVYKTIRNNFNSSIPFNWFILTGKQTSSLALIWIMLPLIICFIGIAFSKIPIDKGSLFLIGIVGVFFPNHLKEFAYRISRKVDENGKKITLSIYLLYWYRLIRGFLILYIFTIPLYYFFVDPSFAFSIEEFSNDNLTLLIGLTSFISLRYLGELLHKKINKIGVRYGFENEYKK